MVDPKTLSDEEKQNEMHKQQRSLDNYKMQLLESGGERRLATRLISDLAEFARDRGPLFERLCDSHGHERYNERWLAIHIILQHVATLAMSSCDKIGEIDFNIQSCEAMIGYLDGSRCPYKEGQL